MLLDSLKGLLAVIPELENRIEEVAVLTEIVKQGTWPASPVAAFLVPMGMRPLSPGDTMSGDFRQVVDHQIAVLLVLRHSGDATGRKSIPKIDVLLEQMIPAVIGKGPDDAVGVFRLVRGQMLSLTAGRLVYQLDLAIQDQIRT